MRSAGRWLMSPGDGWLLKFLRNVHRFFCQKLKFFKECSERFFCHNFFGIAFDSFLLLLFLFACLG